MKYWILKISFFVMLLSLESCIVPFSPPEVNSDEDYLVIDGFLNVGKDTSFIELSRTQNVNETENPIIEKGAKLSVEVENGEQYDFSESTPGRYALPPKQFNVLGKYRLRIKTAGGQEYLSDYVSVTVTPPIDSVTYKLDQVQDAMVFYVNTHDAQNKTRFYRWKFEETWEYRAPYYSALEVVNKKLVERKQDINLCWRTLQSGSILLGSTIKLTSDIVSNLPLHRVPVATNKLFIKYSIIVKQYALSREAFEYWTDLAKTTQGTGSLFDPLPSQVTGNIKNTGDQRNLAFGYFSASTESKQRIFLAPELGNYPRCLEPDSLPVVCPPRSLECALETPSLILYTYGFASDSVLVATPSCVDCRLQGGTTTRPTFWK